MNVSRIVLGNRLVLAILVIVTTVFIGVLTISLRYVTELTIVFFSVVSVILLIVAIYGSLDRISQFDKWISGETHALLYKRICKDVRILNKQGNATVKYTMSCRKNPKVILKQLVHEIFHDGKIRLEGVTLEDKPFKAEVEKFIIRKIEDGEEREIPQPHRLKLKMFLPKGVPKRDFKYSYTVRYEAVYRDMDKKDKEFSSHRIFLPTFWLKMQLSVPKDSNMSFLHEGLYVKVEDKHELEDFAEEQRIRDKYPPLIAENEQLIAWELPNPKLAYTYKLYFCLKTE